MTTFSNKYFLMLVAGAVAIGFAPILVRLSESGPMSTAFWRVVLASPIFFLLSYAPISSGKKIQTSQISIDPLKHGWLWLVALGVSFAMLLGFGNASICYTSVASAVFLGNCSAVFLPVIAWVFMKERVGTLFITGLVLALAGMAFLFMDAPAAESASRAMTPGGFGLPRDLWGKLFALLAAFSYTAYILLTQKLRQHYSTNAIQKYSCLFSGITLLPLIALAGEPFLQQTITGWLVVIALALTSQVLGQGLITASLRHVPAALSGVTLLLQPLVAALLSSLVLHEIFSGKRLIGCLCILVGIACAKMSKGMIKGAIIAAIMLGGATPNTSAQEIMEEKSMCKESKTLSLNKIILYVETEKCQSTFNFYKDGVGLDVVSHAPNYHWCEFNMDGMPLCIHYDNHKGETILKRTGTYLVLNVQNRDDLKEIRTRLLPFCTPAEEKDFILKNQVTDIYLSISTEFYWFRASDPAGNTVQFEYRIKPTDSDEREKLSGE